MGRHYWQPFIPEVPGADNFKGRQIHSHDYRSPDNFGGRRLLVVGAGPSGMDLALHCAPFAEKVRKHHSIALFADRLCILSEDGINVREHFMNIY